MHNKVFLKSMFNVFNCFGILSERNKIFLFNESVNYYKLTLLFACSTIENDNKSKLKCTVA